MLPNAIASQKTIVSAQFPRDLADRLTEFARRHDRSVSAELRRAAISHLERAEREPSSDA